MIGGHQKAARAKYTIFCHSTWNALKDMCFRLDKGRVVEQLEYKPWYLFAQTYGYNNGTNPAPTLVPSGNASPYLKVPLL